MLDCPCQRCRTGEHPDAGRHRRLRTLFAFFTLDERAWCAADLEGFEPALLSELTGVGLEALAARQRELVAADPLAAAVRLLELSADEGSFLVLRSLLQRVADAGWHGGEGEVPTAQVTLWVNGHRRSLAFPETPHSLLVLSEAFVMRSYDERAPVERIYDFGANLGAAALYLSTLQPAAELVCVEADPRNALLLAQNLEGNGLRATVLNVAAAGHAGRAKFWSYPRQAHGLGSLVLERSGGVAPVAVEVEAVPFDGIVSGRGYGLKLDVEGAEFLLADGMEAVLENAAWVTGELHFFPELEPDRAQRLLSVLERRFALERGRPVMMEGERYVIQPFRGSAR
ncbi:MAG: FkbM family methyltransferase [Myxococcaceae bacterium]